MEKEKILFECVKQLVSLLDSENDALIDGALNGICLISEDHTFGLSDAGIVTFSIHFD